MTASACAALQKSTIVRSFSVVERVAPAAGARWAEALWFTVPAPRGRRDRQTGPGRPFQVRLHGRTVAGEVWGEGPVVYLVHGWGGWRWQLDGFVAPLAEAGYRVVAFDAPSHGGSDPGPEGPGRSTILEFADALAAVVAAMGPAHAVVAHSLGATAAAFAIAGGLAVERAAFLAPMADPLPYTRTFAGRLGFGDRVRTRLVDRIERRVGLPLSAFDVPALAGRVPPPPGHHQRPRPPQDPPRPGGDRRGDRVRDRAGGSAAERVPAGRAAQQRGGQVGMGGGPEVVEQVPALVAEALVDVDHRLGQVPGDLDPGQGRVAPVMLAAPVRRELLEEAGQPGVGVGMGFVGGPAQRRHRLVPVQPPGEAVVAAQGRADAPLAGPEQGP